MSVKQAIKAGIIATIMLIVALIIKYQPEEKEPVVYLVEKEIHITEEVLDDIKASRCVMWQTIDVERMTATVLVREPLAEQSNPTHTSRTENLSVPQGLTASGGVYNGPSGKETYYNLDMSGVILSMRNLGYTEEEYPYWVRDDGCKMLGDYIMCAANLDIRPKGTIIETSLGLAIVCDTGGFAATNVTGVDIATGW